MRSRASESESTSSKRGGASGSRSNEGDKRPPLMRASSIEPAPGAGGIEEMYLRRRIDRAHFDRSKSASQSLVRARRSLEVLVRLPALDPPVLQGEPAGRARCRANQAPAHVVA